MSDLSSTNRPIQRYRNDFRAVVKKLTKFSPNFKSHNLRYGERWALEKDIIEYYIIYNQLKGRNTK